MFSLIQEALNLAATETSLSDETKNEKGQINKSDMYLKSFFVERS